MRRRPPRGAGRFSRRSPISSFQKQFFRLLPLPASPRRSRRSGNPGARDASPGPSPRLRVARLLPAALATRETARLSPLPSLRDPRSGRGAGVARRDPGDPAPPPAREGREGAERFPAASSGPPESRSRGAGPCLPRRPRAVRRSRTPRGRPLRGGRRPSESRAPPRRRSRRLPPRRGARRLPARAWRRPARPREASTRPRRATSPRPSLRSGRSGLRRTPPRRPRGPRGHGRGAT